MYSPWLCKEFYMTEQLSLSLSLPQGGQNCLLYISFSQLPFFFFFLASLLFSHSAVWFPIIIYKKLASSGFKI